MVKISYVQVKWLMIYMKHEYKTWESSPKSYIHIDTGGLVSAKAAMKNPLISFM
jgi:hypothetical protein